MRIWGGVLQVCEDQGLQILSLMQMPRISILGKLMERRSSPSRGARKAGRPLQSQPGKDLVALFCSMQPSNSVWTSTCKTTQPVCATSCAFLRIKFHPPCVRKLPRFMALNSHLSVMRLSSLSASGPSQDPASVTLTSSDDV